VQKQDIAGSMKYYLIALLLIIMAAGALTMFEVAYQAMAGEHDVAPARETTYLILLTLWFIVMMICNVIVLWKKDLLYRNTLIVLLSVGILVPVVYMFVLHHH
jgi:cell division protein FtsW (lipid II flippase)